MSITLTRAQLQGASKKDAASMFAANAVSNLAALAEIKRETCIYDFIIAIKDGASAIETWVTPGLNTGER